MLFGVLEPVAVTGERQTRQQAAKLGVTPTLVARPQASARTVAQQQVLNQRQQWEAAAAVAQQAAAEKLQLEQRALERDLQQLRQDQARCAHTTFVPALDIMTCKLLMWRSLKAMGTPITCSFALLDK